MDVVNTIFLFLALLLLPATLRVQQVVVIQAIAGSGEKPGWIFLKNGNAALSPTTKFTGAVLSSMIFTKGTMNVLALMYNPFIRVINALSESYCRDVIFRCNFSDCV